MQLFYSTHIVDNGIILDADESRHCINVLRHVAGDEIMVTDGKGKLYTCRIENASHKKTLLSVLRVEEKTNPFPVSIHLIVAPVKNGDRLEWMLEKAVEIGVSSIRFVNCQRSERKAVNGERIRKIAVAAMKQSLKFTMPEIYDLQNFASLMKTELPGKKLIAWCETGEEDYILKAKGASDECTLMVGPEGDFTEKEIELAREKGFIPVSLGPSRLRTETAALVGIALLQAQPE